jgi:hypothetical protein
MNGSSSISFFTFFFDFRFQNLKYSPIKSPALRIHNSAYRSNAHSSILLDPLDLRIAS